MMGRFARSISSFMLIAALGSAQAQAPPDDAALCRTESGDAAIAACTRAISSGKLKDHNLAVAYDKRGVELDRKSESDKAIADYDEALRLDPGFAAVHLNRARVFRKKREFDRAIADYADAIRTNPKYALAYNGRGLIFSDKAEYDRAIADFDAAIALDPRLAFTYANRAWSYRSKADYDHALADYNEAIRLDPKNAGSYANRGAAWRLKGDVDRAIADLDEAIRLDVKLTFAYRERGLAYRRKDDLELAIANYSVAIRLDPNYTVAYLDRCSAYVAKGDYAPAIADAGEAIRLSPNNGAARNLRGFAYKMAGDPERALPDLNEAIRLAPTLPAGYANRGDIYRQKGDLDHAIADLDEALRLDPSITSAYTNRGLAHEARGHVELARSDFAAAVQRPQSRSITASAAVATARARLAALAAPSTPPAAGGAAGDIPAKPAAAMPGEKRVALVVGNSTYRAAPALPNARRDADAVAAALRHVGFETVNLASDLPKEKFVDALRAFARLSEQADWALIYYAGHGIELNGINYLIPVDARLETDRDVQFETLPLDQLLSAVEGARKLRIILLDACRENPFARQMRRTLASRSIGRGLARVEPDGGTLVAYAAKHGEVALDGEGGNSPFVTALVRHIATPGIEINKLFRLVRDDVLTATGRRQEPFVYGSLPGEDFYFAAPLVKDGP
jgi:tetratricopeptide (TPR) repeat protein